MRETKERENLRQLTTARLTAIVVNMMSSKSARPSNTEDFLPFPPPPRYLTVDEADALFCKQFQVKS